MEVSPIDDTIKMCPPENIGCECMASSVRQTVTVPAALAVKVRRVARERSMTMGRAIIALTERGLRAEAEARSDLESSFRRFMEEPDAARKEEAGKDLIRAVFGKDAIAEDKIL